MTLRLWRYGFAAIMIFAAWATLAQAGVLRLVPVSEIGNAQDLGVSKDTVAWTSEDGRQKCFSASGVEISYESNIEVEGIDVDAITPDAGDGCSIEDAVDAAEEIPDSMPPSALQVALMSGYHPGDVNDDGYVNDADAQIMSDNWQYGVNGVETASWGLGDLNSDGKVDGSDATILAFYWGMVYVPEPTTIMLLLSGAIGLFFSRRLRSQ